jgi:hypothetical protein
MIARVEVFRCVLSDRIVATSNMSARQAKTKMHPFHPQLETFLATLGRAGWDVLNEIQMAAFFHGALV